MKNIIGVVLLVSVLLIGCGEAYYDNVIGITPIGDIADESKKTSKHYFDNMSAVLANNTTI